MVQEYFRESYLEQTNKKFLVCIWWRARRTTAPEEGECLSKLGACERGGEKRVQKQMRTSAKMNDLRNFHGNKFENNFW